LRSCCRERGHPTSACSSTKSRRILRKKSVSSRPSDVDFLITRDRKREREREREDTGFSFSLLLSPSQRSQEIPPLSSRRPNSSKHPARFHSGIHPRDSRSPIKKKGRPLQPSWGTPFISRLSTYVIIGLGRSQKESAAAGTAAALFTLINSTRRGEACQATP